MASVTFQCVEGVESFHLTAADGSDIAVQAGKPFTTSDQGLITALDAASHAVQRSEKGSNKEKGS